MKPTALRVAAGAAIILIAVALIGCNRFSVMEADESAGFNGGFENVKAGLPVNWYFIGPDLMKNGDVEISLDTEDAIEGKHSLKLLVRRTDPADLWKCPGLFQVLRPAKAKHSYKVSFWLKNQGCSSISLTIRNEGKDHFLGLSEAEKKDMVEHPPIKKTLGEEDTATNSWHQFEYTYVVPETDGSIRFELHVMQPGTLWIDDIRIEEVLTD